MRRKIAIIGAGVGGILMIAKLLDASVRPHHIIWIDPYFNVGRIGDKYRTVESNDEVWEWHDVLKKYKCLSKYTKLLEGYDHHRNENLSVIADVLAQITRDFRTLPITCIQDYVTKMHYGRKHHCIRWKLYFQNYHDIRVSHVILSTGSHPKSGPTYVSCPNNNSICGKQVIPLDQALNINILKTLVRPNDCVVIVGSGQSAVLLMKYLNEMNVKSITNVYRHSLQQTIAGLRGGTKRWALAHMGNIVEVLTHSNERKDNADIEIQRVHESEIGNVTCAKLIYATGYERNDLPECDIQLDQDNPDGILGPCIYGIGIAFPDIDNVNGNVMKRVGLASFSKTLDRRLPLWNI